MHQRHGRVGTRGRGHSGRGSDSREQSYTFHKQSVHGVYDSTNRIKNKNLKIKYVCGGGITENKLSSFQTLTTNSFKEVKNREFC